MTRNLFMIDRFSFSNTGNHIIVNTSKGVKALGKKRFEKWLNWDDKLRAMTMEEYYKSTQAEQDLYDYMVLIFTPDPFGDAKEAIDSIVKGD